MPNISEVLRDTLKSPHRAIPILRFSEDVTIVEFLRAYDAVPEGDLKYLPFEAIVLKSGVNPKELLGAIIFCFKNVQASKSALLAMAEHPKVLKKRIQFAKERGGTRDRDALDTAVGFLPSPKGGTISLNFGAIPNNGPKPPEQAPLSEDEDVNDLFPMISDRQQDWQEGRTKLLKGDH